MTNPKSNEARRLGSLAGALLALGGCCLSTKVSSGTTAGGPSSSASSTAAGSSTGSASATGSASSTGTPASTSSGTSTGTTGEPLGSSTGMGASSTGTSSGGTTTGPFGFMPAVPYPVGANPYAIAVADYNSDHELDLAVINHGDGTITLLSGKGDGTFEENGEPIETQGAAYWIAASDLDGDGAPDLAVANSGLDAVQVFFNDAGGFGAPVDYPTTGSGPNCVVAGDFNGDGVLDLATSDYGATTVDVFWGTGDGNFVSGQTLPGFDGPIFVVALDGGSLVVADQHVDRVNIYSPVRDAGLEGPLIFGAGSWPTSLAVGDLNHDGIPDLAASDYNGGVSVMLGTSDGGYDAPKNYTAGGNPNSVAIADFDRDGNLDLAVANSNSFGQATGTISVFLGHGDGTFAPQVTFAVGLSPVDVAVGDFNGDGYPDLAVANSGDGTISILLTKH